MSQAYRFWSIKCTWTATSCHAIINTCRQSWLSARVIVTDMIMLTGIHTYCWLHPCVTLHCRAYRVDIKRRSGANGQNKIFVQDKQHVFVKEKVLRAAPKAEHLYMATTVDVWKTSSNQTHTSGECFISWNVQSCDVFSSLLDSFFLYLFKHFMKKKKRPFKYQIQTNKEECLKRPVAPGRSPTSPHQRKWSGVLWL